MHGARGGRPTTSGKYSKTTEVFRQKARESARERARGELADLMEGAIWEHRCQLGHVLDGLAATESGVENPELEASLVRAMRRLACALAAVALGWLRVNPGAALWLGDERPRAGEGQPVTR